MIFVRVPVIMAPKLLRKQVVTDYKKESIFNKKSTYGPENMTGLAKLLQRGQLDITCLDQLTPTEVKRVSRELKLKTSKKVKHQTTGGDKSCCEIVYRRPR